MFFKIKMKKSWRKICFITIKSILLHRNQDCNHYKSVIMKANATLNYLTAHNVKPSMQRMAVMEYLLDHRTHPTADEIYLALHRKMPTLSKTTVYNTLKILTGKGAALQLTIDEKNCCFDADTTPHAHFLCTRCGKVYDMVLNNQHLEGNAIIPNGFQPEEVQLYFRGCCQECAEKQNDKETEAKAV